MLHCINTSMFFLNELIHFCRVNKVVIIIIIIIVIVIIIIIIIIVIIITIIIIIIIIIIIKMNGIFIVKIQIFLDFFSMHRYGARNWWHTAIWG